MINLWWIDPERDARLGQAMRDSTVKLPVGNTGVRYWQEYAKKQPQVSAGR